MGRIRNVLADVLVGVAIILAVLWLFGGVLRLVLWAVNLLVIVVVVAVLLRIAHKLRK